MGMGELQNVFGIQGMLFLLLSFLFIVVWVVLLVVIAVVPLSCYHWLSNVLSIIVVGCQCVVHHC